MKPLVIKPIATAPTLLMERGKAWRVDIAAIRKRVGGPDATVDLWLIEAPWAHPAWHSYLLSLVHLRAEPGMLLPKLYLPLATHELVVQALDPDGDRDRLLVEGVGSFCKCLTPANFAAQMVEVDDDLARARIRDAVELICQGQLSPDTDYIRQWIRLFGDNMVKEWAR